MLFDLLKKIIGYILYVYSSFLLHLGIFFSIPYLCAVSWKISILSLNRFNLFFSKKKRIIKKKKIIVFFRNYGFQDLEYIVKEDKFDFELLFFPRNNIKKIFNKFFSDYLGNISDNNYLSDNKSLNIKKEKYKNFIKEILKHLRKKMEISGILSFNFRYFTEREIHKACSELGIKFIVCHKESLILDAELKKYNEINIKNGKYHGHHIIVYTERFKKILINSGICEENKIHVTGMPRADYYFKNQDKNENNHILFLIPTIRQPYEYHDRKILFDKNELTTEITKTLIDFAKKNEDQKVIIKSKIYLENEKIQHKLILKSKTRNCFFIKDGDSRNLIKNSKVVIGFNSTGLIEALLLKKNILLPYFNIKDEANFKKFTLNLSKFANYAYSKKEMIDCLDKICKKEISFNDNEELYLNKIIKDFIGNTDGQSSLRLKEKLIKILN